MGVNTVEIISFLHKTFKVCMGYFIFLYNLMWALNRAALPEDS